MIEERTTPQVVEHNDWPTPFGCLAFALNAYAVINTLQIYRHELRLAVSGASSCGTCIRYARDQVYIVAPLWVAATFIIWLAVRAYSPAWSTICRFLTRWALFGWLSVIAAVAGVKCLAVLFPWLLD